MSCIQSVCQQIGTVIFMYEVLQSICHAFNIFVKYFAILLRLSSLNIFVIHSVGLSCISFVCHAFNCVTCSQSVCHLLILFFIKSVCLPCIQTVCQTVSLFVWQSVCLSGSQSVCQAVSLFVRQSVCVSGSQSVCQTVSLFVRQSVCLSGSQYVCQAVSLFVWQSVRVSGSQSVCLAVSLFVWHSVCLSGSQSFCHPSQFVCQTIGLIFCAVSPYMSLSVSSSQFACSFATL